MVGDGWDLALWPRPLREALQIPLSPARKAQLIFGWEYGTPQKDRLIQPVKLHEAPAHLLVCGEPQYGKSTFNFLLTIRDILLWRGVVSIDPMTGLSRNLIAACMLLGRPAMILDFAYGYGTLPPPIIDPFEVPPGRLASEVISELLDAFEAIWKPDGAWGHRTRHILDMTFTALLEAGLPLTHAPDFMMDHDYRDTIMQAKRNGRWLVEHHDARLFWTVFVEQFRGSTLPSYIEAPANKMAEFLKIEYVKQCFSKRGSTVNFEAILNGGVCIVNCKRSRGRSP